MQLEVQRLAKEAQVMFKKNKIAMNERDEAEMTKDKAKV